VPRLVVFLLLSLVGVFALAPLAHGRERDLWATINVCDTALNPDAVGIRASMPGGSGDRMYMRFGLEFFEEPWGPWVRVSGESATRWILAGSARLENRRGGFTFRLRPPPPGSRFLVRGRVDYQWRDRRRTRRGTRTVVVRRETRRTRQGHGTSVGDPPYFSDRVCVVH
jgi:hypothetical protein